MHKGRIVFGALLGLALMVGSAGAQERSASDNVPEGRKASVALLKALDALNKEQARFLLEATRQIDEPVTLEEIIEIQRQTRNHEARRRVVEAKLGSYRQTRSYLEDVIRQNLQGLSVTALPGEATVSGGTPQGAGGASLDIGVPSVDSVGIAVVLIRGQDDDLMARLRSPSGGTVEVTEGRDLGGGWFVSQISPREVILSNGVDNRVLPWVSYEEEGE